MKCMIATINVKNKYEAIEALETFLKEAKEHGPFGKIELKITIDSKGE